MLRVCIECFWLDQPQHGVGLNAFLLPVDVPDQNIKMDSRALAHFSGATSGGCSIVCRALCVAAASDILLATCQDSN